VEALQPISEARSGVYLMDATLTVEAIERATAERGYHFTRIQGIANKADLMGHFKTALAFPDYFGANWDALLDMLRDLSWLHTNGHVILLSGLKALATADRKTLETALDVLADAADFWRVQMRNSPPFIVYVEDALPVKIAPSILAADFTRLGEQVRDADAAGAELIHLDIMDGRFVPNISFGPLVVEAVRRETSLPLDVHLMIVEPERYIPRFVEAGATMINVHVETCPHLHRTIQQIKELGVKVGVAINPHTSGEMIREILDLVDRVLIMTVNPGFGGQKLIPSTLAKVKHIRSMLTRPIEIGVDGGIELSTAADAVAAGANVLVCGTSVFGAKEGIREAVQAVRSAANKAR